ncbi:MAG: signal peptidase I [Chloroflexota bacterium]|nr:signal peptidase I [Chloroflexota bacterium]
MQTQANDTQRLGERQWEPVEDEETPVPSVGTTARELIETVVFILLVFFILRGVMQNFRVEGPSMEPNFHSNQYILVNKIIFFHFDANAPLRLLPGRQDVPPKVIYPFRLPQRGDVVVLEAPNGDGNGEQIDYIKRVVGLPGETVQVKDGKVYINGQPMEESLQSGGYLNQATDCQNGPLCQPYVVPPNTVVVMGDNRNNSQDSRSWNAEPGLPLDRIVGKAWVSYWPRDEWGVIPTPSYAQSTP